MQKWGRTSAGNVRFFCPKCRKTTTWHRDDVEERHSLHQLEDWLTGKDSLSEIAGKEHKTRQALWKEFHPIFENFKEKEVPDGTRTRILTVDGCYIHGHSLCVLVALDEEDNLYWHFAPYESYLHWITFLSSFTEPEVIVMDGQKGLFAAATTLWPKVAVQRCQFHVVAFAIEYIGRKPKDPPGKEVLEILYKLKDAKTKEARDEWIRLYRGWEKKYDNLFMGRDSSGRFAHPRLRSIRLIIRKALPYIFTFLDHSGAPNTTNLVEGWVNGAIAEALRMHRGLRKHEKKVLASVVLSHLKRKKGKKSTGLV
jgi:hypothetical protein